ncbi:hypothetical protein BX600DRAFT_384928 [Xylariales sp. PMI_506]|nr:hypothetical protein BX600DRAFT_384928 [Xylariales sp. PMI_506]
MHFSQAAPLSAPDLLYPGEFLHINSETALSQLVESTIEGGITPPLAAPVATACLACRERHLKCDGIRPCSRCTSSDIECLYISSRRGHKGLHKSKRQRRKSQESRTASPLPTSGSQNTSSAEGSVQGLDTSSSITSAFSLGPQTNQYESTCFISSTAAASTQLRRDPYTISANGIQLDIAYAAPPSVLSPVDRCFDAFYYYFHRGHPFVLPRNHFLSLVREGRYNLNPLVSAMRYIGSLYIDNSGSASASYLEEAIRLCSLSTTAKDGFLVQALLLLIIGLDGSCQRDRARQLLGECECLALQLKLHTQKFASANNNGSAVLEESWRRTWWDLYVCDGMIAGVHRITNFLLFDVPTDVDLPCEEHQYLTGDIPPPRSMGELYEEQFSADSREFSSFTYRITAARNMGRLMRMPRNKFPDDEGVARIDTFLTNWILHLPRSKKDCLDNQCQPDEMMFQAQFIHYACTIMLHQPLSQLDSSSTRTVTSCASYRHVSSGDILNGHTRHTISAAQAISKLITQGAPMLSHTHFFTCVVTLSSIVHLSKWALCLVDDDEDVRQLIRLNIGALNKLSQVWRAAVTASAQVNGVAQEIYREKKIRQVTPAFWVGLSQEQITNSLHTDMAIMNDLETMFNPATGK